MTRHISVFLVVFAAGPALAAEQDAKELASQARAVLKQYCHRCHGVTYDVEGFNVLDRKTHNEQSSAGIPFVTPGKLAESHLWKRVESNTMLPKKERERPSDADKAILKKWIEAGAPDFAVPEPRSWRAAVNSATRRAAAGSAVAARAARRRCSTMRVSIPLDAQTSA